MDQRDVCLFMLGVTGQSKVKKTESLIDVSAFPEHQLHLHNNYQTCPRERKAYVGHWQLCVIIRVPAHRRLDVTAMKMFPAGRADARPGARYGSCVQPLA